MLREKEKDKEGKRKKNQGGRDTGKPISYFYIYSFRNASKETTHPHTNHSFYE